MRPEQRTIVLGPNATIAATGTADQYRTWTEDGEWWIRSVKAIPDIAVTAHASNWSKYTLTNETTSQTIATRSYDSDDGQGNSVAGTPETLTTPTGTAARVVKNDKLKLAVTSNGTGVDTRTRFEVVLERAF